MKAIASYLAIVASTFATASFAACEMPSLVTSIPDGATATEEELLAVQDRIKTYVAAMDRYIACQNEEMSVSGENASSEYLVLMSNRIEAARNEVDAIATQFNDQVNAFRAAREARAVPFSPIR
jgi:hypothetical protein